jgi:predicted acetyltransferase
MGELDIRPLEESEFRAAHSLFGAALHKAPVNDEQWALSQRGYELGRTLGAFVGDTLVGTTDSFSSTLALPGGGTLPMAAVTKVGVRADHTRRGILTSMMRTQLEQCARDGEVLAGLHASEAVIYGRFGYGAATLARDLLLRSAHVRIRPEVPIRGEVRMLDPDTALEVLPGLYDRLGPYRPGVMARPERWWELVVRRAAKRGDHLVAVVHSGDDGDDGFAVYQPGTRSRPDEPDFRVALEVIDFHVANQTAANGLWRFLFGIDLVEEVRVHGRPTDDPIESMLVDRRACRTDLLEDDLWVRLVDAETALAARAYGDADPVVIDLEDRMLPENSGRYRISPDGARRTSERAQLGMAAATLATSYLGSTKPSALAGVGLVDVHDPDALDHADRLFASTVAAFCGTGF